MRMRNPPDCVCGCGKKAAEKCGKDGAFKGYKKLAAGCRQIASAAQRAAAAAASKKRSRPIGSKRATAWGYVEIKVSNERRGWMLEHRWLIEKSIGRKLRPNEHVHHVNGVKNDNRIENLQLLSASEHMTITGNAIRDAKIGIWKPENEMCKICKYRHPVHD